MKNYLARCVLLLVAVYISSPVFAQQKISVSGKVLNGQGEAISGATIREKGSAVATSTDIEGKFSLSVDPKGTLIVSFLGYENEEVPVNGRQKINITLGSVNEAIDEVVVVGYGTQKKANLTGSVAVIDEKAFQSRAVSNTMSALQGAAPGLVVTRSGGQPGSEGFSVNIRGELSTGSAAPLVLIDGVPGSLTYTNPDDILSVSVLKDASSTAIYGSRGAGGVILVTTKTGKGAPKVSYQGLWSVKKMGLFPKRISSWEEAEMQNMARINAGQSPDYNDEQLALMRDPNIYYRPNPNNPSVYEYLGDFNYPDLLLKNQSSRLNHNVSVSGSSDVDSYHMSFGYVDDKGMFKVGPDKYNRINGRLNYNRKISKTINVDAKVFYSQSNTLNNVYGSSNDYGLIYNIVSQRGLSPIYLPESDDKLYAAGSPGGITYALLKDGGENRYKDHEFGAALTLEAKDILTPGLTFRTVYSPRMILETANNTRYPIPMYNLSGQSGFAGGINQNQIIKYRNQKITSNIQFVGEYSRTHGKHEILGRAGYRYDDYRFDNVHADARNLPTDEILALNQYVNKDLTSISDNIQTNTQISFFGTAQYVYDNRYIAQFTLNREGNSKASPANRWITLPGISAGWRINNEEWAGTVGDVFQELKLRGSWGKQANDPTSSNPNASNYDYIALLSRGDAYPFNNTRNTYYYQSSSPTPLRTWEKVTSSDIGVDFVTLNSRLSGAFSYFWRTTNGTYATLVQPALFGLGNPSTNLGVFKSWGWEASISWSDKIGDDFSYNITANIADNNNRVESYLNRRNVGAGVNAIIEGYAKNSVFGYIADGYFQNMDEIKNHADQQFSNQGPGDIRYRDINGDGIISVGRGTLDDMGDLTHLGNTNSRYQYGLNLGFSYKGFDFSAFIQGVAKRSFLLPNVLMMPYMESWRQAWDIHRDYWTPENPDAMFPRLYMGGASNMRTSSKWVVNGAYARLKNVQLGYTLPEEISKKAAMSRVRFFVSGEDLWETTKAWHPYYDPETPNGQAFGYPFFRTVSFGLNATF